MWLGSMKHNTCKILEFKSMREPVKVLGIFLSYNQDKTFDDNFLICRIRKMQNQIEFMAFEGFHAQWQIFIG